MRRREYHWSLFHSNEKNQIDGLRTDQVEAVFAAIPKAQKKEWFIWKEGFDGWKPFEDFPQLVLSLRKADNRVFEQPPPFPGANETLAGVTVVDLVDSNLQSNGSAETKVSTGAKAPTAKAGAKIEERSSDRPVETAPKVIQQKESGRATKAGAVGEQAAGQVLGQKIVLDADHVEPDQTDLSIMRAGVLEDRNNMRFDKVLEVRIFIGDEVFRNSTQNISLKGMQLREALPKSLPRYFNVEIGKGERTIPVVCSEVKAKDGASMRLKIESNEHASALLTMLLSGAS